MGPRIARETCALEDGPWTHRNHGNHRHHPVEQDTATRETTRPSISRTLSGLRGALVWTAIVAACLLVAALAVATFTGGGDKVDIPGTTFYPQAEQYEREAHLDGQAKTYGGDRGSDTPIESRSTDSDSESDEFLAGSRHVPTS